MEPFSAYMDRVGELMAAHPSWSYGQAAAIALIQLRPDLADLVIGTDLDPQHGDDRLAGFHQWLLPRINTHAREVA